MQLYAEKQNQQQTSGSLTKQPELGSRAPAKPSSPYLQLAYGRQSIQRSTRRNSENNQPSSGENSRSTRLHSAAPTKFQTKLAISTPGDIYEQEADRVADRVMRMPEPTLQRKCACGGDCSACQAEETDHKHQQLQTKRATSGDAAGESAAPATVHQALRSSGRPLDSATRALMEPRFGHDFSSVRVHSGKDAEESASDVNAHAYTVGNNIVFGAGQYQPNSSAGRHLLAHELSHTIQQGAAPRQSLNRHPIAGELVQVRSGAPPMIARNGRRTGPSHKGNDPNQLKSELHSTGKSHLFADQVASVYFGTKSYVPDQDDQLAMKALAEEYRYTAQRKGGLKGKVIGHADAEMSTDPDNQELSFQRARWTAASLKFHLGEAAQGSQIDFQFGTEGMGTGYCMGDHDCKTKARPGSWALYRRADVMIYTEKIPDPEPTSCPPASGARVKTLGEYIELIRCAETTTGYSPRQMLAMLRQMYYGKPWSATSQDPSWDLVIPCSPDLGNPKAKLGDTLYEALHNSDTVEGTDLGHVFTGLEAMTCPSPSVTVVKQKTVIRTGFRISFRVDLSNESFATWGGDLGATAGAMAACWMMTNDQRAAKPKECHQGNDPKGLEYYFTELQAPSHDLEGDLAPFVMRAAEQTGCAGSLEKQFIPQFPISAIFSRYFYNRAAGGHGSKDRYRCFAEAIGAKVVNGKIDNRGELLAMYEEKVFSFAWAYYVFVKHEIPRPDPTVPMLLRYSKGSLQLFFSWLEARMQE